MDFLKLIWVIPLFPAAGATINGLLGKRLPKRLIDIVACSLVGLAFIFARHEPRRASYRQAREIGFA